MNHIILFSILLPSILTFSIGILLCKPLLAWLHNNKIWKKASVKKTVDGNDATISAMIHNDEERKTPRMGGLIIWTSVLLSTLIFYFIDMASDKELANRLDFTSRAQTWLPLFSLLLGGILGAVDDLSVTDYFKKKGSYIGGGLSLKARLFCVLLISLFISYWFVFKLDIDGLSIPFLGYIGIGGIFLTMIIIILTIATYAGGVIDGIDGLSGGVMMGIYSSFGIIAIIRDKYDMAALCFAIVASILAFLWYNIPPAKFYSSETGMTGLLLTIVIIAFLLDAVPQLLIIGGLLYMTALSSLLQILSKKYRGKKIFLVAPVHHHFQALGMPSHQVTMRYWIISYVLGVLGILITLV
jgi:phospho-N-acetylmuramoyl-pentapeptide-transferase